MDLIVFMAAIARIDLSATAEAEPAVGFSVMRTAAATGQFGAGSDAEVFSGFFARGEWAERAAGLRSDAEEFDVGDFEG